jgi:DNA repair exonuclease SbcCD ATPase subunit
VTGIVYKRLRVKGTSLYAAADLDLDYKGLTVIYGLNKDANQGSTNAAGKSALLGYLPEMMFDLSPVAGKRDKRVSGLEEVTLERDGKELVYQRHTKKGVEKPKLFINGKDLSARGKEYIKARVQKFAGRTVEEFYALDYIDSLRPSIFQRGSTAQRRGFIVDLFRLSDVDTLRKAFRAEMMKASQDGAAFKALNRQLEETRVSLKDTNLNELRARISKLESRQRTLTEKANDLSSKIELHRLLSANEENLSRLRKVLKNDFSTLASKLRQLEGKVLILQDQSALAQQYAAYLELAQDAKKRRASVKREIAALRLDVTRDAADAGKRQHDRYQKALDRLVPPKNNDVAGQDYAPVNKELLKEDLDTWITRLKNAEGLLEIANAVGKGESCPTCKQPVPKDILEAASENVTRLRKKVRQIRQAKENHDNNVSLKQAKADLKAFEDERRVLERKVKKWAPYAQAAYLYSILPSMPSPFKGEVPDLPLEEVQLRLQKAMRTVQFLRTMKPLLPQLQEALSSEGLDVAKELRAVQSSLHEVNSELPALQARLTQAISHKERVRSLKDQMEPLKEAALDEEAYKLLVDAYGNEGIKKLMVDRIGKHLENTLNRYSKYVYSESYRFKVVIDTQFRVLVSRHYATGVKTSDVRRLSGAESRMFALLELISWLALIPASRRSNLVVLDEPDGNMGEEMRENLRRFLQVLNKIIPHIIVLTPVNSVYPGARCFTAVKHNGVSRLVEGKHS